MKFFVYSSIRLDDVQEAKKIKDTWRNTPPINNQSQSKEKPVPSLVLVNDDSDAESTSSADVDLLDDEQASILF